MLTTAGHSGKLKKVKHLFAVLHALNAAGGSLDPFIRAQMEKLPVYLEKIQITAPDGKELAGNILKDTLELSADFPLPASWLAKISQAFTKELNRTFVNEVLIGVLLEAGKRSALGDQILKPALDDLMGRIARKPHPPADWSRSVPSGRSHDSKVWKILEPFLTSPVEQVFDYRKAQSERSEMENAIRHVTIDLSLETIRKGTPHTLRITKTQAAYKKKLAEWNKDVALLKSVENKFG